MSRSILRLGLPLATGCDRRLRCLLGVDADLRLPGSRARERRERDSWGGEAVPCAFEGLPAVTAEPESCCGRGLRRDCWRPPEEPFPTGCVHGNYGEG